MSNIDYKDLIEQYLTGTISDGNKSMLESKLAADASMRAEMKAQGDIIQGLKDFRKNQLKARLDAIPVEVGVLGTMGQSALVKVAATIGSTALFVGGLYYFNANPFNDVPKLDGLTPITAIDAAPKAKDLGITELPGVAKPTAPALPAETKQRASPLAEKETTPDQTPVATEEVAPLVNKPAVVEFDTDEEFEAEAISEEAISAVANSTSINKPIDVEVMPARGADKLKYQFYEERLYLYGEFGNVPYEILEINSKDGKKTYLYHQEVFYKLSYPTSKISELEKVTNEALLKELKIFRENKALD